MIDDEIAKWVIQGGSTALIAGLIFVAYRKDIKFYTDQWKGVTDMLVKVIQDNTAALVRNTEMMNRIIEKNNNHTNGGK